MECKTAPKRDIFCYVSIWVYNAINQTHFNKIMADLNLTYHGVVNDLLLLQWMDGSENAILLKGVRDNCPCASCAGETDVFGNVYKGPPQSMKEESYIVTGIQPIGYYAIRPFWKDGHSTGIYTFELLKKLCEVLDS